MTYEEATTLLEEYPYFAYAALQALPHVEDEKQKDELRRIVAVNMGNPVDIAEVLGLNSQSLADFYPDTLPPQLSTLDTIDTFLSTFGDASVKSSEDPATTLATHPSQILDEIAAMPADDATIENDATFNAIDSFLSNMPAPQPKRPAPVKIEIEEATPALTESFARILIKNRNYEKALSIIQELNLKNPQKSIYFADQIRFLKKLIANQSKK